MPDRVILLVEDNEEDEELALKALRRSQIADQIDVVRDGEQALAYLFCEGAWKDRDCSRQPDLILLDLKLPKLDGIDVLRRLRADERTHRIPVVIFSSSSEDEDIRRSYRCGANSYVSKPVSFASFAQTIGELGEYWLTLNQSPCRLRLPPPPA
jgi:two-component system response regulator